MFSWLWFLLGLSYGLHANAFENNQSSFSEKDSIPTESLVLVESFDQDGQRISLAVGVMVKRGFVALNYHLVAGAKDVVVYRPGGAERFPSNGYLAVEEDEDLIVISVPALTGKYVQLGGTAFPDEGTAVQMTLAPDQNRLRFGTATIFGQKEVLGRNLPQLVSNEIEECTSGPIFTENKLCGFAVAGYLDGKRYFGYAIGSAAFRGMLYRSFIIKSYNSLRDTKAIGAGYYQKSLMESLTAILWQSMPDAERMARKKRKMILIDVSTKWAGWSKLMDKNTYSKKSIIRYLNENFYSVRLDAESNETIPFNNVAYTRNYGSTYHTLAYSLLEGKMEFPSIVILDEEINEIFVIPGYMDANKMEVMLHFFSEKAYLNENMTFSQFEERFWQRQATLNDQ